MVDIADGAVEAAVPSTGDPPNRALTQQLFKDLRDAALAVDSGAFDPTAIDLSVSRDHDDYTQSSGMAFALDGAVTPVGDASFLVRITGDGSANTYTSDFVAANGANLEAPPYSSFVGPRLFGGTYSAALGKVRVLLSASPDIVLDPADYSSTSFKIFADGAPTGETRHFTGTEDHILEIAAANAVSPNSTVVVPEGGGAVTILLASGVSANAGLFPATSSIPVYGPTSIWCPDDATVWLTGDFEQQIIPWRGVSTGSTTLGLTHARRKQLLAASGDVTYTIPLNSSVAFPIDTVIPMALEGGTSLTVAATGGVTLTPPTGRDPVARADGSVIAIKKTATDTWRIFGDLAAS